MEIKERNKWVLKLIGIYQEATKDKRKWCKYSPTCSNYALGCYKKFNFFKASILTFWRILRCNPFSKGGYDPVPLTKAEKLSKEVFDPSENTPKE